jgi:hypothetical protein
MAQRLQVYRWVQDLSGAALPNIQYTVKNHGTADQALIYAVTSLDGLILFFVEPGWYDLTVSGAGFADIPIELVLPALPLPGSPGYVIDNPPTADRRIDPLSTTVDETGTVVGTLIQDLRETGLIK